MAITTQYFNNFIHAVGNSEINLVDDVFKVILVHGYTFDGTDVDLGDIGSVELSTANGYTAGGEIIENTSFVFGSGVTKFDGDDVTWVASGGSIGPARGAIIYDSTTVDDLLVCYINFGQDESAGDDTDFKITFNSSGIFTIA